MALFLWSVTDILLRVKKHLCFSMVNVHRVIHTGEEFSVSVITSFLGLLDLYGQTLWFPIVSIYQTYIT